VQGVVRGHAWMARDRRVAGYFSVQADEAFIHFCHVDPTCRGRSLYAHMLVDMARRAFAQAGTRRVLIDTAVDNISSQRGLQKAGFRPVASGIFVQLGGRLLSSRLSGDLRAL